MRKIGTLVFGAFMVAVDYAFIDRLYQWSQTGQLLVPNRAIVTPTIITYASDPSGLVTGIILYAALILIGALGFLKACRDLIVGDDPRNYIDRHGIDRD